MRANIGHDFSARHDGGLKLILKLLAFLVVEGAIRLSVQGLGAILIREKYLHQSVEWYLHCSYDPFLPYIPDVDTCIPVTLMYGNGST